MAEEPKIKFKPEDLPEGSVILDQEKPKSIFETQDWSLAGCFSTIVLCIVVIAVLVITQSVLHISRQWSWALWMSGLGIGVFIFRQINRNKKKRR